MLPLYAAALFLSAALVFLVQPLFAKMALPLLGGTPEVWNVCLVFFQAALLAGYGYAYVTSRWLAPRRQAVLHALILLLPAIALPLGLPEGAAPPSEGFQALWLLGLLGVSVGLPFFVVSSTAPLLQRWFAAGGHASAGDPYFLYGASNLGSMLALLSFPFLIEPRLALREQTILWTGGYCLLAALILACAAAMWRTAGGAAKTVAKANKAALPSTVVTWADRRRWLLYSFIPSSWLMGVTAHLTTDIAPVPLLWIVPLALYLLSFILVFARRPIVPHELLVRVFPVLLLFLVVPILATGLWPPMSLHLLVFFVAALVFHGELARRRPAAEHLTEFYFMMSAGGVLGGLFNALLAPVAFPWLIEYPVTVVLAAWLVPSLESATSLTSKLRTRKREKPTRHDKEATRWPEIVALACLAAAAAWAMRTSPDNERPLFLAAIVAICLPLGVGCILLRKPHWFAVALAVPLVMDKVAAPFSGEVLYSARGFFGVHRVIANADDDVRFHHLVHGVTIHGRQCLSPDRLCDPLTYYSRSGPLGQAFAALEKRPQPPRRVAIVGLGAGAIACYWRPGTELTIYEIDPLVKQIAEDSAYFTYLSDCGQGKAKIVLGDGRLQLAKAANGAYDLMIFDAFSSDAVPVHLLTREALAIYRTKLATGGVLLFHTTNNHLDLEAVLGDLAADAGMTCLSCQDFALSPEEFAAGKTPASYVALADKPSDLGELHSDPRWRKVTARRNEPVWRDDYSNILSVLK